MIKRKMAPTSNGGGGLQNPAAKNKRQKLSSGNCKSQKQQATTTTNSARKQQNQNVGAGSQNQTDQEPVWVYGLINNIEQMLSHLNAANNNQRLKEAVQQQQLNKGAGHTVGGGGRQAANGTNKSAKQANKSRPSNNSSGYSTPSSLYSTASLSPPFSSSSLVHCAYSSSSSSNSPISAPGAAQSPRQQQQPSTATTTKTTITTNQKTPTTNSSKTSQQKQQQILPRSPLSRQIKFHEYKGPPQTRRPNNQQKQQLAQASLLMPSGQDSKGYVRAEPIEPQRTDCHIEFGARPSSLQPAQQIRLNPMATNSTCKPPVNSVHQTQVATALGPMLASQQMQQQQQQCRLTPSLLANHANGYRMGPSDNCGRMVIVGQPPAQQISQTTNYIVQPNAGQQQHVSLQLIRGANGQQQQVIVLDAVAFQQMQQQRNLNQNQKQQSGIILLQQEPMQQPVGGYSAPLVETNNGDDNNFQMHQTQSNAFTMESSNCLGDGQFQDDFQNQLGNEIANDDAYYRTQYHQQQQVRTAPATQSRVQARGQHFDAGQCQGGPISEGTSQPMSQMMSNYLDNNQFEQQQPALQPLPQSISDQHSQFYSTRDLYNDGPTTNSTTPLGGGVELDCDAPDDTSEIEPTISFDGDLDHGMMYSEFIDSQDIPLNVDESDWLRKFLPPCTSS